MVDSRTNANARTALVTGASRGIGRAIAEALAREGYRLTLVSRNPERLDAAVQALRADGHEVEGYAADVGQEEAIRDAVADHADRYGRLDLLVNNAGLGVGGPIDEYATRHMDLQFNVDLRSIFLFYREALPLLKAAGAEHGNALVINTSSITGKHGAPWLAVYSAMKHGVVGFTEAMNSELHPHGIKSCALCPGFVDTALSDYMKDQIPAERMITTADVAEMVTALTRLSRWCVVPEIQFCRPGDAVSA